jgi:3-oxoacyl-[acyl-carrier protein] reductase
MISQGRVALVTGSSRGIGAAVAKQLAAEGARVVLNHRDSAGQAQEVAVAITAAGGEAIVVQADVSDYSQAQALVGAASETFGRLDILVNNAGTTRDMLLMRMREADWDLVIATNLKSAFNCCKSAARRMMKQRYGRIVNITSVSGLQGNVGQANYAAAKAGLVGLTKSLAKEFGSRNITVNAVAPGFIPTALTEGLPQELIDEAISRTGARWQPRGDCFGGQLPGLRRSGLRHRACTGGRRRPSNGMRLSNHGRACGRTLRGTCRNSDHRPQRAADHSAPFGSRRSRCVPHGRALARSPLGPG